MDEKLEVIKKICDDKEVGKGKIKALKDIYNYVNNKNIQNVPENTLNVNIFSKLENNINVEIDEEDLS